MKDQTADTALIERLDALDQKLDRVLEEAEEIRKVRLEFDELKDDLSRIAGDLFQSTIKELDDVAPFVKTGDFADLAKRLIRNTNTLNEILCQMESARDFLDDATPLARRFMHDGLEYLDTLDQKGYFAMGKELNRALDIIVTNFKPEDVRLLADNLVKILTTAKKITQPEMLATISNAAAIFQHLDPQKVEEYSLFRVLREINSHEMKRAWGLFYTFLKSLSAEPIAKEASTSEKTPSLSH